MRRVSNQRARSRGENKKYVGRTNRLQPLVDKKSATHGSVSSCVVFVCGWMPASQAVRRSRWGGRAFTGGPCVSRVESVERGGKGEESKRGAVQENRARRRAMVVMNMFSIAAWP